MAGCIGRLLGMVSHNVEHFSKRCVKKWSTFWKRETKVTHLSDGVLSKGRQKVEYFLKRGDESDAPADREFLGLMQR